MIVRIWGTRGSYPVARANVLRYGGNTTCVEVRAGERCIVLDAGTGMRLLGAALEAEAQPPEALDLLITHTHWDHIIGFPFFAPLARKNCAIDVYGLRRTQSSLRTTIANALSDPLLPMDLEDLRARLHFHEIHEGLSFNLGDVKVCAARANHPYRALAYRLETPEGVLAFIPDTGPFHTVLFGEERIVWNGSPQPNSEAELQTLAEMRAGIIKLAQGADWMFYDAQFTDEQYARFPHWGHSTASQAREIAEEAGVRELLLFHHDPHRSDDELDRIVADQQALAPPGLLIRAAYEGLELRRGS
ncbi:MBL fold metallo-hydrolase [Candidatus Viridilinea mediisalina]|uniref:MBL fold metallo-hydrolase n=1 Tax=Candidatus Viridilinea mediisalina TaxID=2024553 RepID=A0A2A6RKW5_9CHLR|nr:MBL fold metallo-hydrolase [Candidatus Viridilinea mediisalina]PDW03529.1 MBL fold metallo-hydrolase [Candidatus Viridilinea mediisalina]